jgi:hypothetical protein
MEPLPTKNRLDTKASPVPASMKDGQKSVTSKFAKETEKILDALSMLKDVMNTYPLKIDGRTAEPLISSDLFAIAFPVYGGHVIKNVVTSDGKLDFEVDGQRIIPVTSEEK